MPGQRKRSLNRAALRRARKLMRGGVAVGLVAAGACSNGHGTADDTMGSGGKHAAGVAGMQGTGGMPGSGGLNGTGQVGAAPPPMSFPGFGAFAGSGSFPTNPGPGSVQLPASASNVLYSWTTDKQIDELRANPVLLTRSVTSEGVHTHLSAVIDALADQGNALAEVLTGGAFAKGRYAWTNPWATLRGWPGESYGNRLLRIELEPEAWLVVLNQTVFSVVDMKGAPVSTAAALGTPERIAGVYYMNSGESNSVGCGSFQNGCATGTYREFFINNEKMVKEWSFGTQQILDELQRSIDFIQSLRDRSDMGVAGPTDPCQFSSAAYCVWQNIFGPDIDYNGYLYGLALTSEYYVPTTGNLDELIKALQDAQFEPDPFVHEP